MNELNSKDWILIKRQDYINLIENAKANDVPVELLEAIYKWLDDKNELSNEADEI